MLELNLIPEKYRSARPASEGSNLLTPAGRLFMPTFFEPRAVGGRKAAADAPKKYSTSIFIPDTFVIKTLKELAQETAVAEFGSKAGEMRLKSPFLKAEDYKYEGLLPGWVMLRPSAKKKPKVLDAAAQKGSLVTVTEDDPEVVYSGRWATLSLNCFAYETGGNRGVAFGLNNVMLLNHDESLSGRAKAEDEFEAPDDDFGAATTEPGAKKSAADLF